MGSPITNRQLSEYSRQIFSDDKLVRKSARKSLLKITKNFTCKQVQKELDSKSLRRYAKLLEWVNQAKNEDFPFEINSKEAGKVVRQIPVPQRNSVSIKPPGDRKLPAYVVTMAHHPKLNKQNPIKKLQKQIELLQDEGFDDNAETSREQALSRLRIVVGVNYCNSINPAANKAYKQYISSLGEIRDENVELTAFAWEPVWEEKKKNGGKRKLLSQKKVKRFFRLLLEADPAAAKNIFDKCMAKCQIPFQAIREEIKNHPAVESNVVSLRRGSSSRPCFLVVWDDDAVSLRTDKIGIFSQYDKLIKNNPELEVATTGYFMKDPKNAFVELASRVDLAARIAIAKTVPNGVYLPEPNLIIRIGLETGEELKRISFLRPKKADRGKNLESVGLLENLDLMKTEASGKIVFGSKGPIRTSISPKVKIPKHIKEQCNTRNVKQKPIENLVFDLSKSKRLSSIRKFYQCSINPKYGFAANYCRTLPAGCNTYKIQAIVAKVFKAYDPIDYSQHTEKWYEIYEGVAVELTKKLKACKGRADAAPRFKKAAARISQDPDLQKCLQGMLKTYFADLCGSFPLLKAENDKISRSNYKDILQAAINSGFAVYRCLQECQSAES